MAKKLKHKTLHIAQKSLDIAVKDYPTLYHFFSHFGRYSIALYEVWILGSMLLEFTTSQM